MACKKTSDLIPFCHPLHITKCSIDIDMPSELNNLVRIQATVSAEDKTGVEMEALTAASVAALTVYDMCKSVAGPEGLEIKETKLLSKTGGKSNYTL
jgi:cyclic pyranopterin phosphate synthase